ncbi:MAG: bifunctional proline dehydrogenase/L-glutamate gamma-semialdehyde dehydrogenase PutA, partial [Luteimonas sp.]
AYRYSFDMLGEGALTTQDALRYQQAYRDAIHAIGRHSSPHRQGDVQVSPNLQGDVRGPSSVMFAAPSISVKLSALHPRYEHAKRARVMAELTPRVLELAQLAKSYGIGFTVDAEEADRLELSLDVIAAVHADASLGGWEGYGLAVQAYQKRTPFVIDFIADVARRNGRRIPVRLVKGAYWDSEIKRAQVDGQTGYPVFTRKPNTDVSYLANARRMLDASDAIYPMFATHNAQTIAAIHALSAGRAFEFQKLHGMGDDLYAEVIPKDRLDVACRVYAPVGSHEDLLPYLVRRLLENGANSSFVNRITDEDVAIDDLIRDPVEVVSGFATIPHPRIPLPRDIYRASGLHRDNSMGINLADDDRLRALAKDVNAAVRSDWRATPLVPGATVTGASIAVSNPADRRQIVGQWQPADDATVDLALRNAVAAQPDWDRLPATSRAVILERAADLLEQRMPRFIALCTKEAGKTIPDGVAEVREAVDFLRYYAAQARMLFAAPEQLPGPTGESNTLQLCGRGVFVCISPWNFPLAIFAGQIAAALAAGNSVIAKPAEQTNLIGHAAVKLMHEAGVPEAVLQFLPGDGATVGAALTRDARVAGVVFTGSTDTARAINRALAARDAAIGVLIAETGGQNALIGDSSALPEQLVKDSLASAFTSAGQRCSAARVLFVQEDIADKVVAMLAGAMAELKVGDPGLLSTDIGPVIDIDALCTLDEHATRMRGEASLIAQAQLDPEATAHGSFFAPSAWEIDSIDRLQKEVFGPALHVVRWKADELDKVIDAINATGYGLTLGIHSRIDETIDRIVSRARVGNAYVNRNQIGAVVGVQPFGGQGLSGTGPKAGGPHYVPRFATEKTVTINTTAAGGNASLLTLGE